VSIFQSKEFHTNHAIATGERPQRQAALVNQHPGKAHVAYDNRRRTAEQKRADDARKAAAKEAKAALEREKITRAAEVELDLGQETEPEPTPKPVEKQALRRTKSYRQLPIEVDNPDPEIMEDDGSRADDEDYKAPSVVVESSELSELEDPRPKKKAKQQESAPVVNNLYKRTMAPPT
jgi:hypothetical protein